MDILERYNNLKTKVVERKKEFDRFIDFLEKETSWLTSPASTKYHLNYKGGLLEHSVGVTETLLKLRQTLAQEITEESCVIVGLFHDLGKVGMPGKPLYLENLNEWEKRNRNIKYIINPEVVKMNTASRSLYLLSKDIPLSDEEVQAILYHDGQFINGYDIAHEEEILTLLLHWSDYFHCHFYEDGHKVRSTNYFYGALRNE